MLEELRMLTEAGGVSGDECEAAAAAAKLLEQYAQDVRTDPFGNVTGFIPARAEGAKTLMLDAHIDRVGFIVTYIDDDGFIKVGACGSPDMRAALAQSVTVHGRRDVRGVISVLPPHVSADRSHAPEVGELCVDVGMTRDEAAAVIAQGDRVTINSAWRECCGRVSAPALDDRSGVYVILQALRKLGFERPAYNIAVCFSAQEETGERGAKQAAFRIAPDEAIAVDVSFGDTPDSSPEDVAKLGGGVMIGFSPALDKGMSRRLKRLAEKCGIAHTSEVMPQTTGTNADAISVSGAGVKCCTLSFPIRYMHTPAELADPRDMDAAAELIYRCIKGGADDE